jgi:hypothetical protein
MLGVGSRKAILYLDQHFWSLALRKEPKSDAAMQRIKALLRLQILAAPYSYTHEEETRLWDGRGEELLTFIRTISRGHRFEPYYQVERTQTLRAFQCFLNGLSPTHVVEERDALPQRVHDWDGPFAIYVDRFESVAEVNRRKTFKQLAIEDLEQTLVHWKLSKRTFEQDVDLELRDSARILTDHFIDKTSRIYAGDMSALIHSPIDADIVGDMLYILQLRPPLLPIKIRDFFNSQHFAEVPCQQLSARLFAAFKKRVREGAYPDPRKANLSGLLFDIQHAATYVPYCDAFFADRFMAGLLKDPKVAAEKTYGCKVFSAAYWPEFLGWLNHIESQMGPEHVEALTWAYPRLHNTEV